MKNLMLIWLSGIVGILLFACSGAGSLGKLQNELDKYPEYNIILSDMREDGNFFPEYYHRYKVVYKTSGDSAAPFQDEVSEWISVRKKEYEKYHNYLGMTIASRTAEGKVSDTPQPPGYQYVGNSRYGQWRTDSNGGSFWEFYGKYAMMRTLFGMAGGGRVYRGDYNDYRRSYGSGRPYYGKSNQYGTSGSYTKQSNPTFFQRRQASESARRKSFQDRVRNKNRRSNMSRSRSRSGGWGK